MSRYTDSMRITDEMHHDKDMVEPNTDCDNCDAGTIVEAEASGGYGCECKQCDNEDCGTYFLCHDCHKADMMGL